MAGLRTDDRRKTLVGRIAPVPLAVPSNWSRNRLFGPGVGLLDRCPRTGWAETMLNDVGFVEELGIKLNPCAHAAPANRMSASDKINDRSVHECSVEFGS